MHLNTRAHLRWDEQPFSRGCSILQATDRLRTCLRCCYIDLPRAADRGSTAQPCSVSLLQGLQGSMAM